MKEEDQEEEEACDLIFNVSRIKKRTDSGSERHTDRWTVAAWNKKWLCQICVLNRSDREGRSRKGGRDGRKRGKAGACMLREGGKGRERESICVLKEEEKEGVK